MIVQLLKCFGAAPGNGNAALVVENDGSSEAERQDFARARQVSACVFLDRQADGGIVLDASLYEQQMNESAQRAIEKIGEAARAAGVAFEGVVAVSPSPHDEIVNAAQTYHCDIILMASHGRKGLNKLFVGSETQKVLAHTHLPVMVLR
ncbi:MAG: universal stress protein [Janthinobacterium sp.]